MAGISLEVGAGDRLAIIGPNGAGKTTLFNLISGELGVHGGQIFLYGRDITRVAAYRRAMLGLGRTYQLTKLFPALTVLENVVLSVLAHTSVKFIPYRSLRAFLRLHEQAEQTLVMLDLWGIRNAIVKDLSYGEQRQVEIALALAGTPRILLLDEPTAGLSSAETQHMVRVIQKLPTSMALLLIEHDMSVAFGTCPNVVVMHQGTLMVSGTPDEIRRNARVREIYLGVHT